MNPITVGTGNKARAIKKGTLPLMVIQEDGSTVDIVLEDYKYSPEFTQNLFSLMKAIESGWHLSNAGTEIKLTKDEVTITFDRISKTKDGLLCGVDMVPRYEEVYNAYNSQSGGEGKGSTFFFTIPEELRTLSV